MIPNRNEIWKTAAAHELKQWVARLMIAIAIGGCALVWFQCHGKDEMRKISGQVYGHVEQLEIIDR